MPPTRSSRQSRTPKQPVKKPSRKTQTPIQPPTETEESANDTLSPPHPLYNTTFTLARLSPLHSFPPLTPAALAPHARTLLSQLRGDVLRGVRIAADPDPQDADAQALSKAGRLKTISWLPLEPYYGNTNGPPIGVRIILTYETITYSALLLGSGETANGVFTQLPLLLFRMPRAPREAIESYLTTTFDAVARPLLLPVSHLRSALETWASTINGRTSAEVRLTFTPPHSPENIGKGLRTINIALQGEEVRRFWRRGGGGGVWGALEEYWRHNAGIEIGGLRLTKIATGMWVLGENRWKGFGVGQGEGGDVGGGERAERAFKGMMEGLVGEARGRGKGKGKEFVVEV